MVDTLRGAAFVWGSPLLAPDTTSGIIGAPGSSTAGPAAGASEGLPAALAWAGGSSARGDEARGDAVGGRAPPYTPALSHVPTPAAEPLNNGVVRRAWTDDSQCGCSSTPISCGADAGSRRVARSGGSDPLGVRWPTRSTYPHPRTLDDDGRPWDAGTCPGWASAPAARLLRLLLVTRCVWRGEFALAVGVSRALSVASSVGNGSDPRYRGETATGGGARGIAAIPSHGTDGDHAEVSTTTPGLCCCWLVCVPRPRLAGWEALAIGDVDTMPLTALSCHTRGVACGIVI